jgi:capsular exopolysaccharide synthesis family protein
VEAVHRIAVKFEHERTKGKQVFLFSSVSEGEGKSTLAANTALSLSRRNANVLFIDLDLRRPVQSTFFGITIPKGEGLGSLLSSGMSPAEILNHAILDPGTGMSTLLSDRSYTDLIQFISSPTLAKVLELARSRYDYIIIDTPPLGYFADSEQISDLSDASVLVVRQDVVPAPEINDAIDALRAGKAEFLGCILNDMSHFSALTSSYGYGYGYGKKYGRYHKYGYGATKKKGGN